MLSFQNKGLIDLAAITTFGVSVKEGNSPIGFFGTGLKFALAVTARLGGKVILYRGLEQIEFRPSQLQVRGKTFDSLLMRGGGGEETPLPFTTELGKLWQPWQAFREFFCNGMDEPEFQHSTSRIRPAAGYTTFEIINCAPLEEVYRNRAAYILQSTPAFATKRAEIHPQAGAGIYYRGVLVHECSLQYAYNVLDQLTLTEDRTLKDHYTAIAAIGDALIRCTDSTICKRVIAAMMTSGSLEQDALNSHYSILDPSDEFVAAAAAAYRKHGDRLPSILRKMLIEERKDEFAPKPLKLSKFEQNKLAKAKRFLKVIGHEISFPVIVLETLGEGVLGQAKDETIFLSRICLDKGLKIIAGTLLEEQLHNEHGFYDCSREFQDYLLDRYITLAEEHVYGEPL